MNVVKSFPIFQRLHTEKEIRKFSDGKVEFISPTFSVVSLFNLFLGEFSCSVLYVWQNGKKEKNKCRRRQAETQTPLRRYTKQTFFAVHKCRRSIEKAPGRKNIKINCRIYESENHILKLAFIIPWQYQNSAIISPHTQKGRTNISIVRRQQKRIVQLDEHTQQQIWKKSRINLCK